MNTARIARIARIAEIEYSLLIMRIRALLRNP